MANYFDKSKINNIAKGGSYGKENGISALAGKLKCACGFSLTELLVALILCLMTFALVCTAIAAGGRQLKQQTMQSEAKMLCATLTMAVEDELRYAMNIKSSGSSGVIVYNNSARAGSGKYAAIKNIESDDGSGATRVVVYDTDDETKVYTFVPYANYTQGTSAAIDLTWNTDTSKTDTYQKFTGTVKVTDNKGNILAQQTFAVKPVNK